MLSISQKNELKGDYQAQVNLDLQFRYSVWSLSLSFMEQKWKYELNHFSFILHLGNQRWSEISSLGLGFFLPSDAGNAKGADLCPASWAIQGKCSLEQQMWREGSSRNLPWVMLDAASLGAWAGVSQEGFPFSLSSRGAQTVLVTPLNSTDTWFWSEINLEESLWTQMWAASPVLSWGSGSVLQNCCKTEFCGLRDKVLRILQQMLPGCWVTDNCGRFVPGNWINFSF